MANVLNVFTANQTVQGIYTLTRVVDTANNTNKYRRFIVLWNVVDPTQKVLLTQTGRWTAQCDHGSFIGIGSTKFQRVASVNWEKRETPEFFLAEHVKRKLGGYAIHGVGNVMTQRDLNAAITTVNHALQATRPVQVTPGVPAPTPPVQGTSTMGALQNAVAAASGVPARPTSGDVVAHSEWLLQAAAAGAEEFELLSAYAQIKQSISMVKSKIEIATDNLAGALEIIVKKGA